MLANVGTPDRIARLLAGVALIVLPWLPGLSLFAEPVWFWIATVVGIVLIATAVLRFCPIYRIFGFSTSKVTHND
ncbi:YgaP family membrane protein [Devosia aquimaris]|uniref:YgaP family membrane protein n=1 Tax=Devosia aquimaris TaxID=2866214 RepID=UPI001CD0C9FE|nr:DUF2892 domain-containing protein [Devosia sp. CJK-A8-3]